MTVDGVVLAFTLGLSVVVGLAFGAVPAFQWSRVELVRTLNEGSAQATGGFRLLRSGRTRAALATAQVALAVVLLVGAGLLLRSFVGLMTVDRGYDPDNVITGRALIPDLTLRTDVISPEAMAEIRDAIQRFAEALIDSLDRMARLPDVAAAGLSSNLPLLTTGGMFTTLQVAGRPPPSDPSDTPRSAVRIASPGYFDVMRLRLRSGRLFTRLDGAGSPGVVVVNETFAREIFGGEPAVGAATAVRRRTEQRAVGSGRCRGGYPVPGHHGRRVWRRGLHICIPARGIAAFWLPAVHRRADHRRPARGASLPA